MTNLEALEQACTAAIPDEEDANIITSQSLLNYWRVATPALVLAVIQRLAILEESVAEKQH